MIIHIKWLYFGTNGKINKIPMGIPTPYPEAPNNYYKKMSRFFSETFFNSVLNAHIFL